MPSVTGGQVVGIGRSAIHLQLDRPCKDMPLDCENSTFFTLSLVLFAAMLVKELRELLKKFQL